MSKKLRTASLNSNFAQLLVLVKKSVFIPKAWLNFLVICIMCEIVGLLTNNRMSCSEIKKRNVTLCSILLRTNEYDGGTVLL